MLRSPEGPQASGRVEGAAVLPVGRLLSVPQHMLLFLSCTVCTGLVGIRDHSEIQRHNKDLHDFLCSGEKRPWYKLMIHVRT